MKMDEEWPDHFEERSHASRSEVEAVGERKLDAMANMEDRPQSLQDYLHDQLGWFDLDPARAGDGGPDHLQPGYEWLLAGPAGGPVGAGRAAAKSWNWRSGRWRWCKSSIRRASAPAISANACCCS